MELYFKDLEAETEATELSLYGADNEVADDQGDTAEDVAFAELSERVSAARLVY